MSAAIRADQVGSLLRPQALLEKRRARRSGILSDDALREAEDAAILDVLALQAETGIEVVSDGEFRRSAWSNGLVDALTGVSAASRDFVESLSGPRVWRGEHADLAQETVPERKVVTGKIGLSRRFAADEAKFLKAHADRPFKITMPSPTMFNRLYDHERSAAAYPDLDALMADIVEIYLREIATLREIGAPYLQLDSLRYVDTIDAVEKGRIVPKDAQAALARLVDIDNRVLAGMKGAGVVRAVHICRGNHRSAWAATGSYESVAEFLLGQVDADRFLMEFDTERAGGFEPLRYTPPGKIVVLGLITTKSGDLEDIDALCRRIDDAAKFVPLESLAISPQCGFASTELGNLLTIDDERRKLELVAAVARKVWG